MLFNSIDFALFLPIVFALYWCMARWGPRAQNMLVIVASYVFYGWWDPRFLGLILLSTFTDYFIGIGIGRVGGTMARKALLWSSIVINLGCLGLFKYWNFFLDNVSTAFSMLGHPVALGRLDIILPVGISFYTFQTLSYTIDVYRGTLKPTKDAIAFMAYVSFFPQLVAGPIERAKNLLPQFLTARAFDQRSAVNGMRQILWGFFKKVLIADNCAELANLIFDGPTRFSGFTLLLGAVFFAFQIYGDFSGYSDIAIGTARLFGFDLMKNFAFPYFSRDMAEFWRRWHISLSTWFRDYLYIPLGGSQGGVARTVRNIFIIFLVSGFWHGANWTFIAWGALHAVYFLPLLLLKNNRRHMGTVAAGRFFPSVREFVGMSTTFGLTVVAWIFFRAKDLEHALTYVRDLIIGSVDLATYRQGSALAIDTLGSGFFFALLLFLLVEWLGRDGEFAISGIDTAMNRPLRWLSYLAVAGMIVIGGNFHENTFIYFQF